MHIHVFSKQPLVILAVCPSMLVSGIPAKRPGKQYRHAYRVF
jgi:hypothetical protein